MNLQAIIDDIESIEFNIKFSVLSGFTTVLSALEHEGLVQTLIQTIDGNSDKQAIITERIGVLLPQFKSGFLHPQDIPVTVYLFVLHKVNGLGTLASLVDKVVSIPEFWWARKMAEHIQANISSTIDTQ
jgi:hypothetical protein